MWILAVIVAVLCATLTVWDIAGSWGRLEKEAKKAKKLKQEVDGLRARLDRLEEILGSVEAAEESARKAKREMEKFNAGVAAILGYDGGGKE